MLHELEQYGGVYDCQRSRDVMIYSLSIFSFALPRAVEVLADCLWRPQLTQDEVRFPYLDVQDTHFRFLRTLLAQLSTQGTFRYPEMRIPMLHRATVSL